MSSNAVARWTAVLTAALFALLGSAAPALAATSQKEAQRKAIAALKLREGTAPVILFQQLKAVPKGTAIEQAGTASPSNRARAASTRDQRLGSAGIAILRAPVIARTGRDAAWLFYEDQAPYESYQHPGRVLLVNQRTGRVTISKRLSWPPLIAGRLPEFLKGYPAYRSKRSRAFIRGRQLAPATAGAAASRSTFGDFLPNYSRLLRVDGASVESRQQAADQLAAQHSCAIRISDTLGDFYDAGPVDKTRAALGSIFNDLARLNSGFYTARYRYRSGTTPSGFVDRAIKTKGCKDVLIYLAGGGYTAAADPAVNVGTRGRPDGRVEQQIVSASELRAIMRRHRNVTFNLEIDAPNSGAFLGSLKSEPNLLILAASSTKGEGAFTALSDVVDSSGAPVANTYNSEQLLEYTNRQLKGLECFLSSPAEVSGAAAAKAAGQTRSFFAYMLGRAFRLCAVGSLADAVRGGPDPVLALLGGEAPPPAPSTNRGPTATVSSVTTNEDTPVAVTLAGADPDGDPLTYTIAGYAAKGTLSAGNGSTRTYTPSADANGADSFTFTVSDGTTTSAPATVTVKIGAVDDAPVVTLGAATTTFTEAGPPVAVDPGVAVADVDDSQLTGAVVDLGGAFASGQDELAFTDTSAITGAFDAATGALTLTGTASIADYQAALRSITFDNSSANPSNGDRSAEIRVSGSATVSRRIAMATIDDAPVLGGGANTESYTEDDTIGVVVNPAITVADVDSANLVGATVRVTGNLVDSEDELRFTPANGITAAYVAATGTLQLSGSASVADYQAALRSVRYRNTNTGQPDAADRTITFTSDSSNSVSSDVTITPVDDAPTVSTGAGSPNFDEAGSAVAIAPNATVGDADDADLEGATVSIGTGFDTADDRLLFTDTAAIDGDYDVATGVLTLSGTDTVAAYQAALRAVAYDNVDDDNPSGATRTISFTATDAAPLTSPAASKAVTVTPINDAPVLDGGGNTVTYTEGDTATVVNAGIAVSDVDSTLAGATVSIGTGFDATDDRLRFTDTATIEGDYNATTGVLELTGADTVAHYQTALRSIAYENVDGDTPGATTRVVTFTASDGALTTNSITTDLAITPVDDASVVTLSTSTPDFTEAGSPVIVDGGITVADVDSANLASATVCVCANRVDAEDELLFTPANGITASAYDAATGTLTLTGTASVSDYQAALRTIQYRNTNLTTPSPLTRGITITVDDGSSDSADVTKDVTITTFNDPPVLGGGGNTVAYTEDDAATVVNGSITAADADDTDLDGATIAISGGFDATEDELTFTDASPITGSYNATTGVLTLSGSDTKAHYQAALRTVKYVNNDHAAPSSASRTISFVANDGEDDSDPVTTTVTIAQHADAPVLTAGTSNTNTFTEGGGAVVVDDAMTAGDADSANLEGATVSVSAGGTSGDELAFADTTNITGGYNAGTRVLTLSGTDTVAAYQAALRTITFASTNVDPGTSRTVSFQVSDGALSSTAVTHAVTVTPINDTPALTAGGTLAYTESDAATAVEPSLALTDDNANLAGATVEISSDYVNGEDVLSATGLPSGITGSFSATTGTYTLSGTATVADYQSALRAVKYVNTSEDPSTVTRTVTFSATDSSTPGLTGTDTASITVTSVNDAPVADDESFSGTDSAIGNTSYVLDDPTDGAPDPAGPQKTVNGDILAGDTDAEGDTLSVVPGTVASNDGGSVTVQADGDFTFTPAAGTSCSDQSDFFDYTVTDGASPTPGTDTGRVTIAITDCVWYVNNQATAGGNGGSATPFDTLTEADTAASTTGTFIYVYKGDGTTTGQTGGVALLGSQRLVGAAEDLTVAGTTLETGNDANRPAISGSVTLGAGNTVEGLAITTSGANAIDGGAGDASGTLDDLVLTPSGAAGGGISLNGTSGTWNVSDTTITATSSAQGIFASSAGTVNFAAAGTISVTAAGPAVSLLSTAVSGAIDTTTSSGGSYGWALNAVTGSLDLGTGTVSGHTSTEVSVTAGTGNVTYAGTIGNGTGTSAVIQNRTAGIISFGGNITDSNDAGGGISMTGNSGGSTTFSGATKTINVSSGNAVSAAFTGNHSLNFTGGGLDIDATSAGSGLGLTGAAGIVQITGSGNTIDTGTGTALSINGPDIGSNDVTFQRISSNGAASGILLANTGTAGGLYVTGAGTAGSGGTITGSTGAGVSLSSAAEVELDRMIITAGGDDGIRGTSVSGLAMSNTSVTNNGDAGGENGMDFSELSGVVTITNATVTGNYDNNLALTNDAATLSNLTIDDGSYGATNSSGGNDSIQIVNTGTGNLTGTIQNADFMNSRGDHIQLTTDNDPTTTSTQNMTIQNNTLSSTPASATVLGGGIALGAGGGANQTVTVDNNDIDYAHGAPLSFNTTTGTSPTTHWIVNNNRIGDTGVVNSGSAANSGLYINVNGNGSANFLITDNTILRTDFTAVDAVQNDGNAAMNITMKRNQLIEPGTTVDYAYGVRFVIGSDDGDNGTSCLDLGDPSTTALKNRFFGSGNSGQGYQDVRVRMAGDATVNLVGYTGGLHDNAAVNSWLQTRNNIGGTPTVSSSQFDADSEYGTAASCPT